nr:uncharacterized protein LOC111847105 [Paramormyrops kingsleyae]
MDFVQRCGVKIPNAVIISGATQVVGQDGQIIDFLKKYGSIKNTFSVDEETSEFHQNLIVEYSYGTAVEDLRAILPYRYTVQDDPCIVYTVRTLCSVYQAEVGANITKNYLTELKTLARLSGIEYEQVLKGMMSQISEDIEAMSPVIEEGSPMHSGLTIGTPQIVAPGSLSDALQGNIGPNVASSVPIFNEGRAPSLSVSSMNPQEVQKVVVEHIVRREDVVPHLPSQILESLLAPAADVVKGLRPDSSPSTYLQLLDSAFGTVEDGEELFAQFLNTLQDPGERPSTYLHRLQVAISLAVKRGGVAPLLVDKHLLKQFCRGCWDNALLSTLQLEQRKSSPPPSIVHDSPQMLLNCTNMLFNDPL